MTSRRGFLLGLTTALAAPAVVRAESLMKLWVPPAPGFIIIDDPVLAGADINVGDLVYFSRQTGRWLRTFDKNAFQHMPEGVVVHQDGPVVLPAGTFTLPTNSPDGMQIIVRAC